MIEIIPNWHPVFVHFTVTLVTITGIWQLIRWLLLRGNSKNQYLTAFKWLVLISAVSIIATVVTGLYAYYTVAHDTSSHLAMTDHRNWAIATAIIFLLGTGLYFILPEKLQYLPGFCFIAALGLVTITGFKGGELVYRHGLGVMALPEVTGEGHSHKGHEHSDGDQQASGNKENHQAPENSSLEINEHQHNHNDSAHESKESKFSNLDSDAAQVVNQFRLALQQKNGALARSFLANDVLIFEGGGVERSADQYASHHMLSDMEFLSSMAITPLEHQVKVFGDTAVSMSRSRINGTYKNKTINLQSIETMVLKKIDNEWKIFHIHWSN